MIEMARKISKRHLLATNPQLDPQELEAVLKLAEKLKEYGFKPSGAKQIYPIHREMYLERNSEPDKPTTKLAR